MIGGSKQNTASYDREPTFVLTNNRLKIKQQKIYETITPNNFFIIPVDQE